jgi:hypothetical protein
MARRKKPETVHDMARRRGLAINKAKRGGWFVTLAGAPWSGVLYCSHDFKKISEFVIAQPRLIRVEAVEET